MYLPLVLNYKKYNNIVLLEKIKVSKKGANYFYLKPEDQFICLHLKSLQEVKNFIKYQTLSKNINHPHFLNYFDVNDNSLIFKNYKLLNESEYRNYCNSINLPFLYSNHSNCSICLCETPKEVKVIRKRKKLSVDEKIDLAFSLGANYSNKKLEKEYCLSKRSLRIFKAKIRNKNSSRKKRINYPSSLTELEQSDIINLVKSQPIIYNNPKRIKYDLQLKCDRRTIANYLDKNNLKLFNLKEEIYLSKQNLQLKYQFCNLVKDLTAEQWFPVVFSDEKILQSYHNSKLRCFRTKLKNGERLNRRYTFFKEKQMRCKINLYGFITSKGVGELFLFKTRATGEDYKFNLQNHILPAINRIFGEEEFVLQQDNATTHNCGVVYNFLKDTNVNLLIWPPKSPSFNIIENCWSIMQRRVNQLIYHYGQPKNDHTLFRYAQVAWKSIKPSTIEKLYNSVPKRINDYLEEIE